MSGNIKQKLRNLPASPGVYLMKDGNGTIIYVGKAKELKKRVPSYFTGTRDIKTTVLVNRISDIDYIITSTEYEALILENTLIKKYNPRYNINLKDGKTYPFICITNEDFPRVFRTRQIQQDGSEYFGPFTDVFKLDEYLKLIEKLFPLRKCRGKLKKRTSPCLYYHIGRCSAPCAGKISKEEYQSYIKDVEKLLHGETDSLLKELEGKMRAASEHLNFERAARYRDIIEAINSVGTKQRMVDMNETARDYVNYASKDKTCVFTVLSMREGKLQGKDSFRTTLFSEESEALVQFLIQYYENKNLPAVIFLPPVEGLELFQTYLKEHENDAVTASKPVEPEDTTLIQLAQKNASAELVKQKTGDYRTDALEQLQETLGLANLPNRIEGFDISHTAGTFTVASMVSFINGRPKKENYRYFKIKQLNGNIDDYKSMKEAVARRYSRLINENRQFPDLILIDGGLGQVNAAYVILKTIGKQNVPVIGLAKQHEEIFFPNTSQPVRLPEGSPPLRILQQVRDEAHRFAVAYTVKKRKGTLGLSLLESIPGIGEKRAKRLLELYGSVEAIQNAGAENIAGKTSIPQKAAENLVKSLLSRTEEEQ